MTRGDETANINDLELSRHMNLCFQGMEFRQMPDMLLVKRSIDATAASRAPSIHSRGAPCVGVGSSTKLSRAYLSFS